ncbi:MAG: VOC family protein [Pseudomonadota bacterium]
MIAKPLTQGAHHIGLTVPNLQMTRDFFTGILGFSVVGERPDYPAAFVTDGATMITLWQAKDPATAVPFDRKTVIGLHHLALKVPDHEALEELGRTLADTDGVEIEFAPEPLGETPLRHLMCTIPGGIRFEFIASPAQA